MREYQTDFEQQKSINDLKKAKEEEAMQKINLIEGELLMSNKKPDLTNRNRSEISLKIFCVKSCSYDTNHSGKILSCVFLS